jgi:hypothetical protein
MRQSRSPSKLKGHQRECLGQFWRFMILTSTNDFTVKRKFERIIRTKFVASIVLGIWQAFNLICELGQCRSEITMDQRVRIS